MTSIKTQRKLLGTLIGANRPLSTMQIAKFAGVAWKTARDNLEALFDIAAVWKGRVGNNKRIYWKNAELE